MTTLHRGYLLVALLFACVLIVAFSTRGRSQTPVPTASEVGRYQLISAGSAMNPYIYFLDTKTGECWLANSPADSVHKTSWIKVDCPILHKGR